MATESPRLLRLAYWKAAEAYQRSLPLEHYMEAIAQGKQRKISLASLELVEADRPDFHLFNELLVQYPFGPDQKIRQVVPDNLIVVCHEPIIADGSYDVPFQPARPFWVMEYVSKNSERKDYEDNFRRYERELKVPYYLLFYPDTQDLTLFHLKGKKYVTVQANEAGRYAIPELEIEVALLDGWVRFWYKGRLLPLPADLQRELEETRRELRQVRGQLRKAREETEEAREQAEQAREQAEQAREQAEQAREQAEQERQHKERLLARLRALGIEPE